ncbi:MAG: MATE family efflux transporter [Clostridia bacterium]|nr:MATE family efflux transporter [Clostridia bacterium]
MKLISRDVNMTSGKILPGIIKFAIPLILTGVLQQLYNTADIFVAGNFGGKEALAAVGATSALINILVNVFINIFIGTNILVARSVGAKDNEMLKKIVSTTYIVSLALGVGVLIFGELLTVPLLEITGCPTNVIGGAETYMRIYLIGVPASMFMNFAASVIRSSGDSKTPFIYLSISGLSNVVCNVLFVLISGNAVVSVALATVVSMYLSAILFFIYMVRMEGPTRLNPFKFEYNGIILSKTIRYGIPAVISSVCFSFTNVIIQPAINAYGDVGISASAASSSIEAFMYAINNAFMSTVVAFVGQNIGAGKRDRVAKVLKTSYLTSVSIMVVFTAVMISFGREILQFYIPGETEAIEFARLRLTVIMSAAVINAVMNVNSGALQAYGYTSLQMVSNLIGVCVFRIFWMLFIYPKSTTPRILWICYPISWVITCVTIFIIVMVLTKKYLRGKDFGL